MLRSRTNKIPPKESKNTTIIVAIIGFLSVVISAGITAYFGFRASTEPIKFILEATQTAQALFSPTALNTISLSPVITIADTQTSTPTIVLATATQMATATPIFLPTSTQNLIPTDTLESAFEKNLILNYGFEEGSVDEYLHWNWLQDNTFCNRNVSSEHAHSGSRFLVTSKSNDNCMSVYQDVYSKPPVGTEYTYGIWLRSPKNPQTIRVALWFTGSKDAFGVDPYITVDQDWRCFQMTLTIDKVTNNDKLRAEIYLTNFDINVDDMYLGYGATQYCP